MNAIPSNKIIEASELPDWDRFVDSHPAGTIFHTRDFIDACAQTAGYEPLAIASVAEGGEIEALLVANRITTFADWVGRLSARSVQFAEPLSAVGSRGALAMQQLLAEHDARWSAKVAFAEIRPMSNCQDQRTSIENAGFEHFNYTNFEMLLPENHDELYRKLSHSRRNNLRANERRGLSVRVASPQDECDHFYEQLVASYARSCVPLVERGHFEAVFRRLGPDHVRLAFAEHGGRVIASACHLRYQGRVYYWYAGTKRVPGIAAQTSLVWDGMQWGIQNGDRVYDFAGAGWEGEHYGPGVFKSRFGAEKINVGRFRKVYSPWRLKVAKAGYQLARPLLFCTGRQVTLPKLTRTPT